MDHLKKNYPQVYNAVKPTEDGSDSEDLISCAKRLEQENRELRADLQAWFSFLIDYFLAARTNLPPRKDAYLPTAKLVFNWDEEYFYKRVEEIKKEWGTENNLSAPQQLEKLQFYIGRIKHTVEQFLDPGMAPVWHIKDIIEAAEKCGDTQ